MRTSFFKSLLLLAAMLCLNVSHPSDAQTTPPTPFTVQMPTQQSALPTGIVPQGQTYPEPGSTPQSYTAPGYSQSAPTYQSPGYSQPTYSQPQSGYVPMTLPPSSGNYAPVAPTSTYNQPSQSNQPAQATKSEVIAYNPKAELKTILVMKTSEGEFKITLKPDIAPKNVENFIDLALGQKDFVDIRTGKKVKRPFYTGLNCHRVLKSVLIQCGCPFGNGTGGPGFRILDERSTAMRFDRPGVIAMALARSPGKNGLGYEPNSAGSQFFISLAPLPDYNGQFTVIGQVTGGMDTIRKIAETPTGPTDRPLKRVIIFSVDPDLPPVVNPVSTPDTMVPLAPTVAPQEPVNSNQSIDPFAAPPPATGP